MCYFYNFEPSITYINNNGNIHFNNVQHGTRTVQNIWKHTLLNKNVLVTLDTATYSHYQCIYVKQNFFHGIDHTWTCLPIESQSTLSLLTHCKG